MTTTTTGKYEPQKLGLVRVPREFVRRAGLGQADDLSRAMFAASCQFPVWPGILGTNAQIDRDAFVSWIKLAAAEIKALPTKEMGLRTYLVVASDQNHNDKTAYVATQLNPMSGNIGPVRLLNGSTPNLLIRSHGLNGLFQCISSSNVDAMMKGIMTSEGTIDQYPTLQRAFQFVTVVD